MREKSINKFKSTFKSILLNSYPMVSVFLWPDPNTWDVARVEKS